MLGITRDPMLFDFSNFSDDIVNQSPLNTGLLQVLNKFTANFPNVTFAIDYFSNIFYLDLLITSSSHTKIVSIQKIYLNFLIDEARLQLSREFYFFKTYFSDPDLLILICAKEIILGLDSFSYC
jgi:hypothetical protein